jgi:hypothetical protein
MVVTAQLEVIGQRKGDTIVKIDSQEDCCDLVEAVVAAADDLQTEIQLRRGVDDDRSFA